MEKISADKPKFLVYILLVADRHNARALRVIGQDLAALGVSEFNVRKKGDDYRVWFDRKEATQEPTTLFQKLSLTPQKPPKRIRTNISFSTSQLLWTDVERSMSRSGTKVVADLNELSLMLRALGDLLDDKAANEFVISWDQGTVKVVSDKEESTFRALNLYDRGTHMYLRRAERRRPIKKE